MPSRTLCVCCLFIAVAVGSAVGQAAIFFTPPDIPCSSPNASQFLVDSASVMFIEDSAQPLFPFHFNESGLNLCTGFSGPSRTEVVFNGYTIGGDQVEFDSIVPEHLGGGLIRWMFNESDPMRVEEVLQQFSFFSLITNDAIADNPQRNVTVTVYPNDVNITASSVTVSIFLMSRNDPPVISLGDSNNTLTVREDVDTGQRIFIIQEPQLLVLSDEESNDLTRIEVTLLSPNGALDGNEYIVLMNNGDFDAAMLSATSTSINYTGAARFDTSEYFSYKLYKDFLRNVLYYTNADEPSFFNDAGESLLREISITVTDSVGDSSTAIININILPNNDHRPVLHLNGTPGCFRNSTSGNSPVVPPAAVRGAHHNTSLVEQIRTNVWSAYNDTGDFMASYGAAIIAPSVSVALLTALGTSLAVWLCYCRCRRGDKRQHRTLVGKRARKYLFGTGTNSQLPVVQVSKEKGADVKRTANNSVPTELANGIAQGGAPPQRDTLPPKGETPTPLGDLPAKVVVPKDLQKKKKKREPVTLASLAAKKATLVNSDIGETAQEESLTLSVENAPNGDHKSDREQVHPERIASTDRSQLLHASATGKAKTKPSEVTPKMKPSEDVRNPKPSEGARNSKPSEGAPKSQRRRGQRTAVEVLSPQRVVNATDVRVSSTIREEGDEGRDVFGDLPQLVSPQRRSGGGLSQVGPRQQRNISDTSTIKHEKTDIV